MIDIKVILKTNLEDLISYFSEMREKSAIVFLMIAFSSLLVCIGLNFDSTLVIYSGLFISPFIYSFIQFTIGIYQRDNELAYSSFFKIVIGSILTLGIGAFYFYITPFAYNMESLTRWSEVNIPSYIGLLLLGLTLDVFNRHRVSIIIWILKLMMKWSVLIILTGLAMIKGNMDWVIQLIITYKLVFLFFFMGFTALLISFRTPKKSVEGNRFKFIYPILLIMSFVFGIYFGVNELLRLTTKYNTEQYLYNELNSTSFRINNFVIEKNNKEILVFYTGIKPALAQDTELKNKYHLSGYHFEYREFK